MTSLLYMLTLLVIMLGLGIHIGMRIAWDDMDEARKHKVVRQRGKGLTFTGNTLGRRDDEV